jgi:excisionase family DNA binding protein
MAASDLLTPQEAATELRVSIGTIYNLIAAHRLPVIQVGRQNRVDRRSVAGLVGPEPPGWATHCAPAEDRHGRR